MEVKFGNMSQFFDALKNPEYGFLYLEPVLIWGIAIGLATFIFALLVREPKTQMFGLIIVVGSCMLVGPYSNQRIAAEKRIVSVYQHDQPTRAQGFATKSKDRRDMKWLYYLTAGLGLATVLVGVSKSKLAFTTAGATLVVGIATVFYGSVQHFHEAQLYHPNLRKTQPPPPASVADVPPRLTPVR
ncbi:MAG: uncharacterized membrane protein YgdD (TMEM256/DUF423 family) [Verrucomicrobiales bacterium]|jgi:uncharacterized membrane protein YgdD (TMEM256/DUF423 family)